MKKKSSRKCNLNIDIAKVKEKLNKIWNVTKKASVPMLLAIVNFLLFLLFAFLPGIDLFYRILCIMIGIIPTICFYYYASIISTYLTLKRLIFNIIFPFIIVIPYCIYLLFSLLFLAATSLEDIAIDSPITDISNYKQHQYYFPSELPDNYDEAKYYYYSPFSIDPGEEAILYLKTDTDFINYYKKKYKPQTIRIHQAYKELNEPYKDKYENDITISKGFVRYLLVSKCYLDNSCSHGEVGYILINEDTKEILFYYKYW